MAVYWIFWLSGVGSLIVKPAKFRQSWPFLLVDFEPKFQNHAFHWPMIQYWDHYFLFFNGGSLDFIKLFRGIFLRNKCIWKGWNSSELNAVHRFETTPKENINKLVFHPSHTNLTGKTLTRTRMSTKLHVLKFYFDLIRIH